jgi:hypothetical protein
MARSISVKIPTANVVTMIEDKVAQLKIEIAEYPTKVEEYKAERKAYTKRVAEMVANIITVGQQELFEGDSVVSRVTSTYPMMNLESLDEIHQHLLF